jgi:glutamate carboxypeptidase
MSMRISVALAALAFLLSAPAAAELSAPEQRMITAVDSEQERTVDMLAKWVNQNSGSLNSPGVEAVGRMLRSELEPLGFKVEWLDMKAAGRAGHIVARHVPRSRGNGRSERMLLIGHLDTVFEPDSSFQRWERQGNRGIGPGAGDNKGGMAVMIAALRAMQSAGTLRAADMTVVLTGDEEDAGDPIQITRGPLIEAGKWADVALDFEGLAQKDGKDMGSIARRSSDSWTIIASGRTGHSSGVMHPEYGAIYEIARIIDAFRRELGEDKLTYNVGLVGGGATAEMDSGRIRLDATGKTNIIAAVAVARGDLRAISQEQIDRAKAKMQAIVAQSLPATTAQISFDKGGYPPMAPTEGSRALLARLNRVNADMGLEQMGELDPMDRGAGDISFVAKDVDGLVGLGPAGSASHAPGESVDIASIFRQAKRAAILMSRLARERR